MREIGPEWGEGVTRRARALGLAVAANTIASGMEHAFLETEALKVMPRLIEERNFLLFPIRRILLRV
jgi:hypothetical protein